MTLSSGGGAPQELEVDLPWAPDPAALSGDVTVEAQLQGTGEIGCRIQRGGELDSRATSDGSFPVVRCNADLS
ncbi:hypothetical protein BH18ACT4_BH18ACT4_11640 [soil metagenome]